MSDVVEIEVVDEEAEAERERDEPQFDIFSSRTVEQQFISHLRVQLDRAYTERQSKFAKLRTWRRMADNENTSAREPAWEGASNINVPVIPILNKTATSRLKNTFNARRPFWSIKALNKDPNNPWIQKSQVLENYFNIISNSRYDLNLHRINNKVMTDLPVSGAVWMKVSWTHLKRNIVMEGFDEAGESVGDVTKEQVVHDGPEFVPFRSEAVFYRESFQNEQSTPWIGFMHSLPWHTVKLWGNNGHWDNIDKIEEHGRVGIDAYTQFEDVDQQNRDVQATWDTKEDSWLWDIFEIWAYYDVNDDGDPEDVVCWYHRLSNTLLAIEYNRLGTRPLRHIPFYERPWAMEGQGVTELSEDMQDEINSLHNMRNDGIHLTEAAQYAVRRGSGIRPKERVRPGKVWFLDNPNEDIKLLQTSKSYVETANLEQLDYSYLERVTGIQDIAGGFSSMLLKSRDSASSQGLRMGAGSEIFHGITEGVDLAYQDLAEMLFRQLVAHKEQVIEKERKAGRLSEKDIETLSDILNTDVDQIPSVLAFKARLVEEAETYDGKRQSLLTLITIYQSYVTQILPLIVQTYQGNPQILQVFMQKFVEGATELMQDVFRFFGQEDVGDYLITTDKIQVLDQLLARMQGQMGMMNQIGGGGDVGSGNGAGAPAGQPGPMGNGGGGLGASGNSAPNLGGVQR